MTGMNSSQTTPGAARKLSQGPPGLVERGRVRHERRSKPTHSAPYIRRAIPLETRRGITLVTGTTTHLTRVDRGSDHRVEGVHGVLSAVAWDARTVYYYHTLYE